MILSNKLKDVGNSLFTHTQYTVDYNNVLLFFSLFCFIFCACFIYFFLLFFLFFHFPFFFLKIICVNFTFLILNWLKILLCNFFPLKYCGLLWYFFTWFFYFIFLFFKIMFVDFIFLILSC